jgi:hypothetical protein
MPELDDEHKKIAAAIAAVIGYLRTEEEIVWRHVQAMRTVPPAPVLPHSLWGLSGRQSMMQMRSLMQMRTFRGRQPV